MFKIDPDREANTLRINVEGFWAPENVSALARAIDAHVRQMPDDFDVIVESPDFPVQANDVADLLAAVMRGGMVRTSGHAAVVVGGQLGKAQAERTLVHPRLKVFLSLDDAKVWLAARGRGVEDLSAL
jgi:hypothetical protein